MRVILFRMTDGRRSGERPGQWSRATLQVTGPDLAKDQLTPEPLCCHNNHVDDDNNNEIDPTLTWMDDQGYIRVGMAEGKKPELAPIPLPVSALYAPQCAPRMNGQMPSPLRSVPEPP